MTLGESSQFDEVLDGHFCNIGAQAADHEDIIKASTWGFPCWFREPVAYYYIMKTVALSSAEFLCITAILYKM